MSNELKIAIELAKKSEGFKPKRYLCPAGKLTQGYGRNLEAHPLTSRESLELVNGEVSMTIASRWLEEEMVAVEDRLRNVCPVYREVNEVRKAVLLDMGFNMGVDGLLKFKNMFKSLEDADYASASRHMKDSAWYIQVGDRSKRDVLLMAKGTL